MPFTTSLVVQQVGDDTWVLVEDLVYEGNVDTFTVTAGTPTDFASVPKPFRWLVPKYGRYNKAAVLHDWLWKMARRGEFSRCDADGIFRRTMRELEVPFLLRWLMWTAVRWGSWLRGCGPREFWVALSISLLALPYVTTGAALFIVLFLVYYLVEVLAYAARWVLGLLRGRLRLGEPFPRPTMIF